ncbi:hypothetical protein GCM10009696_14540 [Kocuria himachalensis]
MLSTRFTGSSTSITVESVRRAASTAVSAPGRPKWRSMNAVGASWVAIHSGERTFASRDHGRSKNDSE